MDSILKILILAYFIHYSIWKIPGTVKYCHQAEVLDDHACDSNYKKLLRIIKFLACCHILAAENLEEAEKYLDQLTQAADPLPIQCWTEEIEHVEVTRLMNPAGIDIYVVPIWRYQKMMQGHAHQPSCGWK